MESIPVNFGGQSNAEARFVNCFLDVVGPEGKTQNIVQAHDGLIAKATQAGATGTRGVFAIDSANLIWVAGVQAFHVDNTFTVTSLGGIPGTGPVTFAKNRKKPDPQIMVAGDGHRFLITKIAGSWALNRIEDPDLLATHSCAFVDGYFLGFYDDGRWGFSSIDEGTEWAALDRIVAEGDPDKLVRGFVYDRDVMLFGEKSLEIYKNTGSASTFERTGFREIGCKARFSVSSVRNGVLWVATDDTVQLGRGLNYQAVSNYTLHKLIEDTDPETLRSWSYHKGGNEFYTLASDTWCWEMNIKTRQWNERESLVNGHTTRWRGEHTTEWGNLHIVGDVASTALYALDEDAYDEAGNDMVCTLQPPVQHNFPNGAIYYGFALDMLTGVGLNSTDEHSNDPKISLRWSNDGGHTFGNPISRSVGKIGRKGVSVRFNDGMGESGENGRIWQMQWSAPVLRRINAATAFVQRKAA